MEIKKITQPITELEVNGELNHYCAYDCALFDGYGPGSCPAVITSYNSPNE